MESRPNHPKYSQLGFKVHRPKPPQQGLSCSLLPFAGLHFTANQEQECFLDIKNLKPQPFGLFGTLRSTLGTPYGNLHITTRRPLIQEC